MLRVRNEDIAAYLRQHPIPGLTGPLNITEEPAEFDGQRFTLSASRIRATLKLYGTANFERARREVAGLRLGGRLALAPALLLADDSAATLPASSS
jgi:hypothetical protein